MFIILTIMNIRMWMIKEASALKELETRLAEPNVILSSWILSWTSKQEHKLGGYDPDEDLMNNVVFMEYDGYIHAITNGRKT